MGETDPRVARQQPLVGYKYNVSFVDFANLFDPVEDVQSTLRMGFSSVKGLSMKFVEKTYMEGSSVRPIKIPVSQSFGDVTFERGVTVNELGIALIQWHAKVAEAISEGTLIPKAVLQVVNIGGTGNSGLPYPSLDHIRRFGAIASLISGAYPKSIELVGMDAGKSNILINRLVLACDNIEINTFLAL